MGHIEAKTVNRVAATDTLAPLLSNFFLFLHVFRIFSAGRGDIITLQMSFQNSTWHFSCLLQIKKNEKKTIMHRAGGERPTGSWVMIWFLMAQISEETALSPAVFMKLWAVIPVMTELFRVSFLIGSCKDLPVYRLVIQPASCQLCLSLHLVRTFTFFFVFFIKNSTLHVRGRRLRVTKIYK